MIAQTLSLLFYPKKPKNYVKGPMPIYLRITVDGIPKELSIGRVCDPSCWFAAAQRATGNTEEIKSLNNYIDLVRLKAYEAKVQLSEQRKEITASAIKNILQGRKEPGKMLLVIFKTHNEQIEKLLGAQYADGTLERYKTSYDHTKSFLQFQYGIDDISITSLNYEFITNYEFWLKSVRKCNHNTTIKYLGNFRKIVNSCIRKGWLTSDPFAEFKMSKVEVEREVLSEAELEIIINKVLPNERLRQIRDVFIFCCFTGLAYSDIKKLKRTEICIGIDGEKWIFTHRKKTEIPSHIPLLQITQNIIDRYQDHPLCINKNLVLPVPSNQKLNAYLKEIAHLCDISKEFTSHTARHTFATTVTLNNGVPIESVSKMLGHTNIRMTQHYAKLLDKKVSDDMQLLKEKLKKVFVPAGIPVISR